ncbi:hypothetical protein [Paenibacillus oryzisoli]|uniref:Oxidoreductase molybdopterin-binding domain-containing protein n=1 Tax=Paenibacillus oryzisoli TaxID=1850517 RepID=A0A198AJA1_9BACL|nr:hypothetical protein [Paenibacillus oryzisoli]OAS21302.1 hypothetical protein A8708_30985 [Paenibacillus oryzisoli]
MQTNSRIEVSDLHRNIQIFTVEEMVAIADLRCNIQDRVPSVEGEAFDLKSWYRSWHSNGQKRIDEEPTHVRVEAVDEFQALIPWGQTDQALFLYAQEGQALKKGYPIRLYVPDGSSECLNVKSIIKIWFINDPALGEEATYGFKNKITLDELKFKK